MKIIVACDLNNAIGKNNKLLYKLADDMAYFKKMTTGNGNNAVVMGRKTFESLPKPLRNRDNYVLTHDKDYKKDGAITINSFDELNNDDIINKYEDIWIIGGGSIYEQAMRECDVTDIYLTKIYNKHPFADIFFINLNDYDNIRLVEESCLHCDLQTRYPFIHRHYVVDK